MPTTQRPVRSISDDATALRRAGRRLRGPPSTADDDSTYEHDALDRVVKQREKHGTGAERVIDFSHVALSSLLSTEKHTVGGTLEKTLTYGYDAAGHRITMGDTGGLSTDRYTYGYDVHGNTSLLVNQSGGSVGQPKASYGYRPYADPDTALTLGDPQDDDPVNPMRYSARRYDSGSGSLDMGARRYQSGLGRFLQFDQYSGALSDLSLSSDPLTGNRYALAGGNPVGYMEWDGHIAYRNGCGTGKCGGSDPESIPYVGSVRAAEHRMEEQALKRERVLVGSILTPIASGYFPDSEEIDRQLGRQLTEAEAKRIAAFAAGECRRRGLFGCSPEFNQALGGYLGSNLAGRANEHESPAVPMEGIITPALMGSVMSGGARLATSAARVAPQVVSRGGAGPVRVGQQGLDALGVTQNTSRIAIGGGRYRVPDISMRDAA